MEQALANITVEARDGVIALITLSIPTVAYVVKHFLTRGGDREKRVWSFEDSVLKDKNELISELKAEIRELRAEIDECEQRERDTFYKKDKP